MEERIMLITLTIESGNRTFSKSVNNAAMVLDLFKGEQETWASFKLALQLTDKNTFAQVCANNMGIKQFVAMCLLADITHSVIFTSDIKASLEFAFAWDDFAALFEEYEAINELSKHLFTLDDETR